MPAHAHKLIYETAKGIAHELYDVLMFDDALAKAWREANPDLGPKALEARFVAKNLPLCLPQARATLAVMLTGGIDQALKDEIEKALILDASLRHGRGGRMVPAHRALANTKD